MKYKMLRGLRVAIACCMLLAILSFFLDFDDKIPQSFAWLAKVQLLCSVLGHCFNAFFIIIVATFLVGRVYCSAVCPLGILQDAINWLGRVSKSLVGKKDKNGKRPGIKRENQYRPNHKYVRLGFAVFAILSTALGGFYFGLIEPYSIFGRIAVNVFKPLYVLANNIMYAICQHSDSAKWQTAFYYVDLRPESWGALIVGLFSFIGITIFAGKFGRLYCNTVCPIGSLLGLISRVSFFKTRINADKCVGCGLCAKACKSSCINVKDKTVDSTRCVVCFDCFNACRKGAISFGPGCKNPTLAPNEAPTQKPTQETRLDEETLKEKERAQREAQGFDRGKREFLTLTALAATATVAKLASGAAQTDASESSANTSEPVGEPVASAEEKPADYGLKPFKREYTIMPPGAPNRKHFEHHCVGCHLCVAKCPSRVLKPSGLENGLLGFMQPRVDFTHGFCNFDCTTCGDVCPTAAILPLTQEKKHVTQMGHVVFIKENCIVYAKDEHCGACSEHCPTQAIHMVPYGDSGLTIPETTEELCVGCGGCEFICPARPHRAVYIEGNPVQKEATPPPKEEVKEVENVDFGF